MPLADIEKMVYKAIDYTSMTDVELIDACLNGQQDGFAELVNRYKNLVYSIILRMTKSEANDLAQDVFLKMYKNLRSYSPEFKFSTWVMKITSNHIIDYRRKTKLESLPLDAAAVIATAPEDAPEAAVLRIEEQQRVRKIVEDLPSMYRIPIVLYHQKGMTYHEIAEKIGEPLSKVKNRIFRGRKLLKESYLRLEGR